MGLLFLTAVFLFIYALLLFYYKHHWQCITDFEPDIIPHNIPVSVVIAARNEEANLPSLLQALEGQTYPKNFFEVIVVDDFSTDKTAAVVQPFLSGMVMLIQPDATIGTSSKKKAIETGVRKATGELIVVTDADCQMDTEWLQTIVAFYMQRHAAFIAAPVKYSNNSSLLQIFQTLDFMVLQGITAASVSAGFHAMCNGANLAYTKEAFLKVNGFEGIEKVASGDDMLLMYKIGKEQPSKIYYLKSDKAIVTTQPMPGWKDFIMQRRRWASKTLYYNDYRILAVLIFVYLFNVLFFVLLIAAINHKAYAWMVLLYLIIKTGIEIPFVNKVSLFFGQQKLMKYFPFFQPFHILYTVSIGLISQLGTYEWKGRRTK